MNILYVHGFGSQFDPESRKSLALGNLGEVFGINLDYTQPFRQILEQCKEEILAQDIDLVVGTSMGGYTVCVLGVELGIPFVAINPARNPSVALRKYLGPGVDHNGREFTLEQEVLDEYEPLPLQPQVKGLVLLDQDDEVINANLTLRMTENVYPTYMFPGGSHRFDHMTESLGYIKTLMEQPA